MNPVLLSLVASPVGADANAGMMAKAPPGESPPESPLTFLQTLLQSLSAAIRELGTDTAEACLSTANEGVVQVFADQRAVDQAVLPVELEVPRGAGEDAGEPTLQQLTVTMLGALAQIVPVAELPLPGPVAQPDQAAAGTVAVAAARPLTPLALEEVETRSVVGSPPAGASDQPPPLMTMETVEPAVTPLEQDTVIPAPEKREGAVKQETARPTTDRTAGTEKREEGLSRPLPDIGRRDGGARAEKPESPPQAAAKSEPPGFVPSVKPALEPELEAQRPVEGRAAVQDTTGGASGRRSAALNSGEREGAGRTAVVAQVETEPSESQTKPERAVKPPARSGKAGGSRAASQGTDAAVRVTSGRYHSAQTTVLMPDSWVALSDEPVLENSDRWATGTSLPRTAENPEVLQAASETGARGAAAQHAVTTGRDVPDPVVSKSAVNNFGPLTARDGAEAARGKDTVAPGTLAQMKLTDELSQSVLDQVVRHMSLQSRGEASEMRMTLDPPSLGEVRVTVRVEEGRMHAQIDVSQSSVKVALESSMPQLRQALNDSGIEVRRIDVCTSGSSMSRESHEGQGERQRRRESGRTQVSADGVEQYRASRMMGYNTIEMVM